MTKRIARIIITFALIFVSNSATAQANSSDIHQGSSPPSNARFEIVQSQLAAKWTFRLDRYTGSISQLVRTENEGTAWEDMFIIRLPVIQNPNRPRFIIFTSGLAARHTFLMDTDTGQTWQLISLPSPDPETDSQNTFMWEPFEQ